MGDTSGFPQSCAVLPSGFFLVLYQLQHPADAVNYAYDNGTNGSHISSRSLKSRLNFNCYQKLIYINIVFENVYKEESMFIAQTFNHMQIQSIKKYSEEFLQPLVF